MANTDFIKQHPTKPAFEELVWSKPVTKRSAGKLLIVGGNYNGISGPLNAYSYAEKAGIGVASVLLPSSLKSIAGKIIEQGDYAPSTPSGSFSKQALAELLDKANWADAVLLAGDLGRNSETAVLLESFLAKTPTMCVLTKDAVDYVVSTPAALNTSADKICLVCNLSQLQKYVKNSVKQPVITYEMTQPQLVAALKELSIGGKTIVTKHHEYIYTAVDGDVSVTDAKEAAEELWQLKTASHISVWLAQQPEKKFQAVTTAVWDSLQTDTSK
jgi:ADP-dependent NAD(P)H-hydrate dehydratase / NAD(P)H-hydrate epimerase